MVERPVFAGPTCPRKMNYSAHLPASGFESKTSRAPIRYNQNVVRESLASLSECLGADSWLTASVTFENPEQLQQEVLASFQSGNNYTEHQNPDPTDNDFLFEALLAETKDRNLWERSQLETRRFYATYDWIKEDNAFVAFYATSNGLLQGILFRSSTPFSKESVQAFRYLFDSVAAREGKKSFLGHS